MKKQSSKPGTSEQKAIGKHLRQLRRAEVVGIGYRMNEWGTNQGQTASIGIEEFFTYQICTHGYGHQVAHQV